MLPRSAARFICRRYSQAVTFRTTESSPSQHTEQQTGLFYTINNDVCKQIYHYGGLPKSFQKQTKTFTETSIMVRQPALDVINCMKAADMNKPAIRYVLYGDKGSGKSISMAHVLHYAHENGYLIVHIPWASEWLRRVTKFKEMSNSATRDGLVDLPLDAAAWLVHFKSQNAALLKSPELTTSREYTWSRRETTPAGAPLAALAELGVLRVKYACDAVHALVQEIKTLTDAKKVKTFVAIDGFNTFFYPRTRLNTPTKRTVAPEDVTLTHSALELTRNDWTNAAILLTVDKLAVSDDHHESHLPLYLLYKKGFEHLDPFVPVPVANYSDKEFASCAGYYRDRLWLRGAPALDAELRAASNRNPYYFMEMCAPL